MVIGKATIKKKNSTPLEVEFKKFIVPIVDESLFIVSEAVVKEVQENIKSSLQRPDSTGNLASSFFAEPIAQGYGIGNIDYLNQNARYWHWINYGIAQTGRKIPPKTTGFFYPGQAEPMQSEFRTGRFEHTDNAYVYLLNPQRAIEPHNYIERTNARILEIIKTVLN